MITVIKATGRALLLFLAILSFLSYAPNGFARDWNVEEIQETLQYLVDDAKQGTGIVVGLLDKDGTRIVAYGKTTQNGKPVDGDTVYEIGSITKVFTGIILADMVLQSKLKLDDPVQQYLPSTVTIPTRNDTQITFKNLAQHNSALPRMPNNFNPKDPQNPYADYTSENMYSFLNEHKLSRDIGSLYEYSNLGVGLLGHTLALIENKNYAQLVTDKILVPLNMNRTAITLSDSMKVNLAVGHTANLEPTSMWDIPTLAGAGALRSSANDMLKFLSANLGYTETSLKSAIELSHSERSNTVMPNMKIALNWHIRKEYGAEIIWHNGGTGGYRTFAGINKAKGIGVVVLNNSQAGLDELGFHLLEPQFPGIEKRKELSPQELTKIDLQKYTGDYQLTPSFRLNVTLENGALVTQATGQGKIPIFAESENKFFAKVVNAQITFVSNDEGKTTHLILHQGGRDQQAMRVGDARIPKERKEVTLSKEIFQQYEGDYTFVNGMKLNLALQGDGFTAQLTGQPRFPIFAESETEFFWKIVDAQLTIDKNADGEVIGATLHQNGMDQTLVKIK